MNHYCLRLANIYFFLHTVLFRVFVDLKSEGVFDILESHKSITGNSVLHWTSHNYCVIFYHKVSQQELLRGLLKKHSPKRLLSAVRLGLTVKGATTTTTTMVMVIKISKNKLAKCESTVFFLFLLKLRQTGNEIPSIELTKHKSFFIETW